jgi:glycyl-tRNA synthetase beta chain
VNRLTSILEHILGKEKSCLFHFPNSMRWGDLSISFARPDYFTGGAFRRAPCLIFSVGNIESSNWIYGHPVYESGKALPLNAADQYDWPSRAGVIPDIEKRRSVLVSAIEACAKAKWSGSLKDDEACGYCNQSCRISISSGGIV